eukprot:TRINITY_DN20078_c0_g2_i1.p1 TRINITY_DN20078_c0_g2~~TRINITY_DN20078_c0_g2_i1.p1  ORF type:complete len:412 (+),score=124.64 TRINITY_DN20078_c0_g2_i1:80-1315(+)
MEVPAGCVAVAIPSYDRPQALKDLSLALLDRQGVPREHIFIFVANEDERARYAAALDGGWPNLIVGVPSLWRQRNFITKFFAAGCHVLSLDDDVEELYRCLLHPKQQEGKEREELLRPLKRGELLAVAQEAERRMRDTGAYLWSFNVSDNPFYMMPKKLTQRCGLCNGFFWGCIIRHDASLELRHGDGHEDVERSVRHYAQDGVVLRFREFCVKTKCGTNRGGLQRTLGKANRQAEEEKAAKALCTEFPEYLHVVPGSKLGLKFKSGIVCELGKRNLVGITALKDAAGMRKLERLAGGRWAVLREQTAEAQDSPSRISFGLIEKASSSQGLVFLSDQGVRRAASLDGVFQAIKDGTLFIVYLPKESCQALSIEYQELPTKGLFAAQLTRDKLDPDCCPAAAKRQKLGLELA